MKPLKDIEKLIKQYSIAYMFCGNNTEAKIKLSLSLNKKLKP